MSHAVYCAPLCDRRKVNQRAMDTIQQNLETEAKLKMEAVVVRKKLEQDITELEITLEGVNKARAETEKNWKQCQQEVDDLETLLEEEQKSKFDLLLLYGLSLAPIGPY